MRSLEQVAKERMEVAVRITHAPRSRDTTIDLVYHTATTLPLG